MVQWLVRPDDKRQVKEVLDGLCRQFDNTGIFTCTASTTSMVVQNAKCAVGTIVSLVPQTRSASVASGNTFAIGGTGQFTVYFDSATTTDRKFAYVMFGV